MNEPQYFQFVSDIPTSLWSAHLFLLGFVHLVCVSTHFFILYDSTALEQLCVDVAWYLASHVLPAAGLGFPCDWSTAALPLRFGLVATHTQSDRVAIQVPPQHEEMPGPHQFPLFPSHGWAEPIPATCHGCPASGKTQPWTAAVPAPCPTVVTAWPTYFSRLTLNHTSWFLK